MAGTTRVDIRQLKQFQRNLDKLAGADIEKMCEKAIKELAREFLAKVVQVTPVGQYKDGRVGGTLRRGWTASSGREAELGSTFGGRSDYAGTLDRIEVKKVGNMYQIEIINPVEYASYVNNGHRTKNNGFVNGRFFMEIASDQVERRTPAILNKHVTAALRGAMNGN